MVANTYSPVGTKIQARDRDNVNVFDEVFGFCVSWRTDHRWAGTRGHAVLTVQTFCVYIAQNASRESFFLIETCRPRLARPKVVW